MNDVVTQVKSWLKENQTLAIFLVAQLVAFGTAGISIVAYYVRMETRVTTMETRGAEYTVDRMNKFDQRITVLEQQQKSNTDTINRVVEIMTRELRK
jgi:exopolysaccharide biosynthesis protein